EYRHAVAKAQQRLGEYFLDLHRHADAQTSLDTALKLLTQLTQKNPLGPEYRYSLAGTHLLEGRRRQEHGRAPTEAEKAYKAARDALQQLVHEHPNVPDYQHELANAHRALAELYRATGRQSQADAAFLSARQLWEPLARRYPRVPAYQNQLAACLTEEGRRH